MADEVAVPETDESVLKKYTDAVEVELSNIAAQSSNAREFVASAITMVKVKGREILPKRLTKDSPRTRKVVMEVLNKIATASNLKWPDGQVNVEECGDHAHITGRVSVDPVPQEIMDRFNEFSGEVIRQTLQLVADDSNDVDQFMKRAAAALGDVDRMAKASGRSGMNDGFAALVTKLIKETADKKWPGVVKEVKAEYVDEGITSLGFMPPSPLLPTIFGGSKKGMVS